MATALKDIAAAMAGDETLRMGNADMYKGRVLNLSHIYYCEAGAIAHDSGHVQLSISLLEKGANTLEEYKRLDDVRPVSAKYRELVEYLDNIVPYDPQKFGPEYNLSHMLEHHQLEMLSGIETYGLRDKIEKALKDDVKLYCNGIYGDSINLIIKSERDAVSAHNVAIEMHRENPHAHDANHRTSIKAFTMFELAYYSYRDAAIAAHSVGADEWAVKLLNDAKKVANASGMALISIARS